MTQQSNGSASDGPPSLFGEAAAAGSSDKTISILSAVTGKELAKSSARRKAPPMRTFALFLGLLITGVLGLGYWQYGGNALLAMSTHPALSNVKTQPLAVTQSAVVAQHPKIVPKAVTPADTAVIEMVKNEPAAPVGPSAELNKPEPFKALLAEDHIVKAKAHPRIASTPTPPAKDKIAGKKVAVKTSRELAKVPPPEATPPKSEAAKQKSMSVARTSGDPDEKLLEGMLRLMKRDNTKDKTNMSSAK
jgi:hypothetical protein